MKKEIKWYYISIEDTVREKLYIIYHIFHLTQTNKFILFVYLPDNKCYQTCAIKAQFLELLNSGLRHEIMQTNLLHAQQSTNQNILLWKCYNHSWTCEQTIER